MTETDGWLRRYEETHSDLSNPIIYWAAVPMIVLGTVGIFWYLPIPAEFVEISPLLNWGSAFLMAAVVYYFIISLSLAIGMLPFVFGIAVLQIWLVQSPFSQARISSALFVLSLAGLALGHLGNGGMRAVLRDIQLMMIAPVWLLSNLYRNLGIPY